jgi:hypothetical protein
MTNFRDHDDYELERETSEQRRNKVFCKCGFPDWPGQCPGWQFCPVHGEGDDE